MMKKARLIDKHLAVRRAWITMKLVYAERKRHRLVKELEQRRLGRLFQSTSSSLMKFLIEPLFQFGETVLSVDNLSHWLSCSENGNCSR
jgi:hypothetical protein